MVALLMLAVVSAFHHASIDAISIDVDASNVTNSAVNRRAMGCHSDYGFGQTPRGFTANMIYGSSFEHGTTAVPSWLVYQAPGSTVTTGPATGTSFSAKPSMRITTPGGNNTFAGLSNRGIGGSGFALQGGLEYLVELWLWSDEANTEAFVELRDFAADTSLAKQVFPVLSTGPPWGSTWFRYNFSLTPSASTSCEGIAPGSDPTIDCGALPSPGHACIRCGGEFVVGIAGKGAMAVGFISLTPGSWGLVAGPNGPISALKSAADVLKAMGVTVMRSGGTVSQAMRWKDWRGPVWNRPSQQMIWTSSLLSGWGPFEVIDMCNALDIEPIITLAYDLNSATDWGDLVEYCWGDSSTPYGRLRIEDGHPAPYNITTFELGNEQYNPNFLDQVAAMELRSKQVSSPPLHYMFPDNDGLNEADRQAAVQRGLPIDRLMPDLHVGAGGAVEAAQKLFDAQSGFPTSAINCETNAGTHDLKRALDEATDLIDWFTAPTGVTDRMYARTASFCTAASAQFDNWDQGISFFAPNMTWFQPPGYVHVMITNTWADKTLRSLPSAAIPFAAQLANDKTIIFRAVNSGSDVLPLNISLSSGTFAQTTATLWTLSGDDLAADNTMAQPAKISPVSQTIPISSSTTLSTTLSKYTFATIVAVLA